MFCECNNSFKLYLPFLVVSEKDLGRIYWRFLFHSRVWIHREFDLDFYFIYLLKNVSKFISLS